MSWINPKFRQNPLNHRNSPHKSSLNNCHTKPAINSINSITNLQKTNQDVFPKLTSISIIITIYLINSMICNNGGRLLVHFLLRLIVVVAVDILLVDFLLEPKRHGSSFGLCLLGRGGFLAFGLTLQLATRNMLLFGFN